MTAKQTINRLRWAAGPLSATVTAVLTLVLLAGAPNAYDEALGKPYRLDTTIIGEAPARVVEGVQLAASTSLRRLRAGSERASSQ